MLKHEIMLLVTYRPPKMKGGGAEEYRFAKGFILLTQKGAFHTF